VYELKVGVTKVLGKCTADPPMKPGDYFTVRDGDIRVPEGGYICLWALQSVLPLITPKEREIAEREDEDWMWRVHHAQCPDPEGRVIFKIERVGKVEQRNPVPPVSQDGGSTEVRGEVYRGAERQAADSSDGPLHDLQVVVEEVRGKCTSGMRPGDYFVLRSGRLYIPADRHFCLYALHAALPLLPAKQRAWAESDWLTQDSRLICPDPAGNVIMRIDHLG
jgi:uncharacterized repeat protein (TIGR04076 family)